MGEPYVPTEEDRRTRRELAARIVESVRADEEFPVAVTNESEALDVVFGLAQEVTMLADELRVLYYVHDAALANRGDSTRLRRIDEALARVRQWRAEQDER